MTGTGTETMYRPSRYLSISYDEDGSLIVYSSRTGAMGVICPADADRARAALKRGELTVGPLDGVLRDLADGGLLVDADIDEAALVDTAYHRRYTGDSLHLIVMPTEQCNFRCVYCYETFTRGQMSAELQQAIAIYATAQEFRRLKLSWFGGEPLLAADAVLSMTRELSRVAAGKGADFICSATTNGSLLTPDYADQVIPAGLRLFQISLDGLRQHHDAHRIGFGGEATYETIMANLRYLRDSTHDFEVAIRYNFDRTSIEDTATFYDEMAREFRGDRRFVTELQPIGRWGGAEDENLPVCEGRPMYKELAAAKRIALERGFRDTQTSKVLAPDGAVCYAADPRSFVIGSDGSVYKCTVELDYHDRNVVGRLLPSGEMSLDWDKMALWTETNGLDDGKKCSGCHFRPACHGAACPKEWMDDNDCECPKPKHVIGETLRFVRTQALYTAERF